MLTRSVLIIAVGLVLSGAAAQANEVCPNLVNYGWENGGTVLGMFGSGDPPLVATNVTAPDPVHSGLRSLRLEDNSPTGTPEAHVAWVTGLQDGDVVQAGLSRYDTTPGAAPSARIWAHYTAGGEYAGSAGGNSDYGPGEGWDLVSHEWSFDAGAEGDRDGLMIDVRVYSNPGDTVWMDDLYVCAPAGATVNMPIPEPATLSLLLTGAVAALQGRRRSRIRKEVM